MSKITFNVVRALVTVASTIGGLLVGAGCHPGGPASGRITNCKAECQDAQGNLVAGDITICADPTNAAAACASALNDGNTVCNNITADVTATACSGSGAATSKARKPPAGK